MYIHYMLLHIFAVINNSMPSIEEEIQQNKFLSEHHKMVLNIIYTANWIEYHNSQKLKKYELTPAQFNILRILRGQHPKPATVNLLIERMLDKMSNASRLVDKLTEKKLVERRVCKIDRRAVDVLITQAGLELLVLIDKEQAGWDQAFANLSQTEALEVNRLMDKLRG